MKEIRVSGSGLVCVRLEGLLGLAWDWKQPMHGPTKGATV